MESLSTPPSAEEIAVAGALSPIAQSHERDIPAIHLRAAPFFAGFAARSRSSRSAVRFAAAASDAFLARADRCSGVMVSRLRLPPILPPLLPISRMISENSAFVFLSIHSILRRFRKRRKQQDISCI